ncbi:forkhead box protein D3-like [Schistocerca cancellata]|uniref:forkhead box protein D3-like n=1 Tax=Schistocerca cancellata TaxID=274614 RepID=UPI00211854D6|nr:forkhead box protein D3-like [Schistocerca cancellata]
MTLLELIISSLILRSAPLPTPSLSVSSVDGTGKDAANSLHTDDGHCEADAPAPDETVSTGTAATSTSGSDGTANGDGSSTGVNGGGTTASDAATGVGEEQHTGNTDSASTAEKRPPFSYKALIAMAIAQSPHRKAKLSEIYAYITSRFPYFEHNKKVWQNSIRHNLSLHKCFIKVLQKGRKEKGNYWVLDPQFEGAFKDAKYCQRQCNKQPFPRDVGAAANSAVPGDLAAADLHFARDEHSSAPLTTPSLSVSNVDSTGKDAANSVHTDNGHCEADAPAPDETVSTGTAATLISGSEGTVNGDGSSTGVNGGGSTASDAASGVGEEQHTGNTDSASTAEKRPPFSYKALIAMAIAQSPHRKAKLSEIYAYITRRFPYFEHSKKAWQNSIRHNLSLHKCFVKVLQKGRKEKGNYWMLDPQFEGTFKDAKYCQRQCNKQPFHRDVGAAANSAVPGGVAAADLHFARYQHRSTEIPSFEESYLQNVSGGEVAMKEEKSIHFISCGAPTRGIILQLDNSFCSAAYMSMVDNIFSVFTCSSCLQRFSSKYSLIMHVFIHIDCVQPPLHVCRYCGEVFLTYFGLNKHLRTKDDDGTLIARPFSDAGKTCHSSDLCSDVVSSEDHVPVSFDSVTGNSSNEQVTNTDLVKRADSTRRKDDSSSCIQAQQKDCYT